MRLASVPFEKFAWFSAASRCREAWKDFSLDAIWAWMRCIHAHSWAGSNRSRAKSKTMRTSRTGH